MTTARLYLLCLTALLFLPSEKVFAADPPVRKVTVTGTATIKVVPDEMQWSVQVSINDGTLAKAKGRHDASLSAALAYVKSLGDAAKDLQTGGIRIDKQTYFPENADRSKPFNCSTQFTFTLTDFDKYGPICDALAKFDGIQVQSVDYAYSKADETARTALKNALVNAHAKADDLAGVANCTIDKPLDIQEGTSGGDGPRPMMMMAKFSGGGTPAAVPGQLEIGATVTATYDLLPK